MKPRPSRRPFPSSPAAPSARLPQGKTQGVVLDVDGTLYHLLPLRAAMVLRLALSALIRPGRTLAAARLIRAYRQAQEHLRNVPELPPGEDPQLDLAAQAVGIDPVQAAAIIKEWMRTSPLPWLALARRRALIRRLQAWHELGVPMAVYSDYPAQAKLSRLGLDFLAPFCLASTDPNIRAFKPHPQGFLVAAERLGLPPENLVYLGDRMSVDAAGAQAAGMGWILLPQLGWRYPKLMREAETALDELEQRLRGEYGGSGQD